jgi:uncharacterized membrane protein YqhA
MASPLYGFAVVMASLLYASRCMASPLYGFAVVIVLLPLNFCLLTYNRCMASPLYASRCMASPLYGFAVVCFALYGFTVVWLRCCNRSFAFKLLPFDL